MNNVIYIDSDWAWMAQDKAGYVGMFVTAGHGPIPFEVLRAYDVEIETAEENVLMLMKSTECVNHCQAPNPKSFIEIAQRGIYAFDWTDVHRVKRDEIEAYEIMATPKNPITAIELPPNLQKISELIVFKNLYFSDFTRIDPKKYFACIDNHRN